tara:strand:+ start:650 stop:1117 length:468 start_codon:yes stop_codon:yes gene_type:complete
MDYKGSFVERVESFDVAEIECESFLKKKKIDYIRYGFDHNKRIKSDIWFKLPQVIRNKPDFIVFQSKSSFLEVKGCKDILKVKLADFKSYDFYNQIMPLSFFFYSTTFRQIKMTTYKELKILTTICPIDKYKDNNKEYYKIDWGAIDDMRSMQKK